MNDTARRCVNYAGVALYAVCAAWATHSYATTTDTNSVTRALSATASKPSAVLDANVSPSAPQPVAPPPDPVELIYTANKEGLLWSAYGQPKESAYEALESLQRAPEHGLEPTRYATDQLYELIQNSASEKELRAFDRLLTASMWTYSEDLRIGQAHEKPRRKRPAKSSSAALSYVPPSIDQKAIDAFVAATQAGALSEYLNTLPPTFAAYKNLQALLDRYTDHHLLGGWEPLPEDLRLTLGDTHLAVGALRQRLAMTDGLPEHSQTSDLYDEEVQAAIIRFQTRHGLATDGELGPSTLRALNISSADKIERIKLNLARLRQLPKELPEDHITVNIPEFKLRMYLDAEEALSMGVVVGSRRTPTPAMQDEMRHLVFNPYWYPPHNITVREILPKLRRDPSYLERSGFELLNGKTVIDAKLVKWKELPARNFPFRLRQVPGEKNALGAVKFIFPNKQAIYLHDTPSRKLFGERVRAFSHGCIRLEQPTKLATQLMAWDRGWTEDDVLADISAAKRKLRKFNQKMAIYLLYQTAEVSAEGVAFFFPDIYGHDRYQHDTDLHAPLVAKVLGPNETSERQQVATR